MGNISPAYGHFTQLQQQGTLSSRSGVPIEIKAEEVKALNQVKNSTRQVLATGVAGSDAQQLNTTLIQIEQISRLSEGDVNAVNLRAVVDLGSRVTQGDLQQFLGTVGTPLAALASVEGFSNTFERSLADPSARNLKSLLGSTRNVSTSVGQLSLVLAEHAGSAGSLLARGGQALGRIRPVVNVGIAGMDIVLAGKDIQSFWQDPSGKNLAKMGLGLVAASASVLNAAQIPVLGNKAAMVAVLADVAKIGLDVNWGAVATGVHSSAQSLAQREGQRLKEHALGAHKPIIRQENGQPLSAMTPILIGGQANSLRDLVRH